jgi:hypothetical protein
LEQHERNEGHAEHHQNGLRQAAEREGDHLAASGRSAKPCIASADSTQRTITKASHRKSRILRKSVAGCKGV